ncbi:MAG: signal peptidase I [Lachnospiraceae bacterium]|nr:signal peptidase I [Lachnospiraceae bacterium]
MKILKITLKVIFWLIILAGAVVAAWAITKYCVEKTNMTGNSMKTTLSDGDKILINRMSYRNSDPERFDVIVFEKSGSEHSYYGIRRVIGLPGEKVQIKDGFVYINGEKIEEPINVEEMKVSGLAASPIVLDDDEFFVLGDNRNSSEDSRFTSMGNVTRSEIIGKAWIRTNSFGIISRMNLKSD